AGVLGSAIGMDKDVQKRLLRDAHLNVARFTTNQSNPFGYPVFVKPANTGSSVGISKAHNPKELAQAIKIAKQYDIKILVEEAITGREIEVSVLGNENPIASIPGEVLTNKHHQFYSYEAKYLDENGATLVIPAKLSKSQVSKIQKTAITAYKALCCEGMARVDMFLTQKNKIYINEINTIPGFTSISMYPKLWEASGLSQTELIDKLITLALNRFAKEQKLQTSLKSLPAL
ncbi:D-alanine--D-alanine ligase, partial [Candidatus Microgenomates bacterium]|nr:D-alanine--D-alanine ligase [Candidatus Microgenomates bacterium]